MNDPVGVRLRQLREEAWLSQRQLAERCGVPLLSVAAAESGTALLKTAHRLAGALGYRLVLVPLAQAADSRELIEERRRVLDAALAPARRRPVLTDAARVEAAALLGAQAVDGDSGQEEQHG